MAEMNLEQIRKHCREVYEKWEFIRQIVGLYEEGVSWKGCDKMEVEAIKNGVRGMLVSGTGDFNIKTESGTQAVATPIPSNIPFEEPGQPFLWPYTQNATHLDNMKKILGDKAYTNDMFQFIIKDICKGLGVLYELLGPLSATADGDAIMMSLITFSGNIRIWRDYLGSRLELAWNENWRQSGLAEYGVIYQVFRAQGIDLRTLREQALNAAKSMVDSSLFSRQTYNEAVKWFFEDSG